MDTRTLEHLFVNVQAPFRSQPTGASGGDADRRASKVGGTGKCYRIVIFGEETSLYEEDEGKWFVEAKENVRW